VLAHVFLQWACVVEGIVPLCVKLVGPAVEAGGGAVTLDGRVDPAAVGGVVFSHGVATVSAVSTPFVGQVV